ncbi:P2 family phage major capsid protein [Campylobacter sp. faydin G-140]|uniref:P2 family phage major capsid protein n=1 Tax=Campylobacter anatolicus TaxID=2829105 RepID=UPI001B9B381E|nr:P2 family phage major capsid protein [Campylobacter anatolicus]MBR8466341.1 P2 family phage major capsid protein [Campylobacter anatolicus]
MSISLQQIAKTTGPIKATDMYESGALRPEVSRKIINTIVDKSEFLSKITIDKTKKLQKSFDVWGLANGILVRVTPGKAPTEAQRQKLSVKSVLLDNKPVQLYAKITQDTLEDNADNPNFESETFDSFAKTFSNDLQNLGMNGENDDYSNQEFKNLNKGWFTLAKEKYGVKKLEHKKESKISARLIAMVKSSSEDAQKDSVIILSQTDYLAYQEELGNKNGGLSILLNTGANQILGIPLVVAEFVPKSKYLMTPLKNLIMSIGLDIRRVRWYDHEKSSLMYKFEVYNDYEIGVDSWVTLSEESEADSDGDGV